MSLGVLAVVAVLPGCSTPSPQPSVVPEEPQVVPPPLGMVILSTNDELDVVQARLHKALDEHIKPSFLFEVNHQANAEKAKLDLSPIRVDVFGKPQVGTPLMVAHRTVAIDLPQKILLRRDDPSGPTTIAYNSVEYLEARHGLADVPQLETVRGALQKLSSLAAGAEVTPVTGELAIEAGEGLVIVPSAVDFETTVERFRAVIEANDALIPIAAIDHADNAAKAGLELPPTMLLMFGNPRLGTPLMHASSSVAIDLPQKVLIYEEDGEVMVVYNDPAFIAKRHRLEGVDEQIETIRGALESMTAVATTAAE